MYKVISFFTDLQDNEHPYEEGNTYPREGVSISAERIAELSGSDNRQGRPLIQEVAEDQTDDKKKTRKKA